jgi:hypothetical protein
MARKAPMSERDPRVLKLAASELFTPLPATRPAVVDWVEVLCIALVGYEANNARMKDKALL